MTDNALGKGEVESSILSCSTINPNENNDVATDGDKGKRARSRGSKSGTVARNWQKPSQPKVEPITRPGYLYRYWSERGTLLYIGISVNAVARLAQHRDKAWFSRITRIDVERFQTYEEAEKAELRAICYEGPIHNLKGPREATQLGPALSKLRSAQKRRAAKPPAKVNYLKVRAKYERDRYSGRIAESMSFDQYYFTPELSGVQSEW